MSYLGHINPQDHRPFSVNELTLWLVVSVMRNSKLLLTLTFLAGAVAQTALAQPVATTPPSVTRNASFPPVGLALSETMQVNVVNLAENPTATTGTSTTSTSTPTPASCTGSISFFNAAGTAIGTATTFTVTAGETQSASITLAKAGITGSRPEIRAVIQTTTTEGRNAPPCSLGSSLETFDSGTGVTHVYLSGPALASSPEPVAIPVVLGPNSN